MIFRSPHDDIEIPRTPLTPFVLHRAAELGDKPALVDGPSGRVLTYRQLASAAERVAGGLAKRGFRKGDVFAIYSSNLPEYALAFHGVATAGGVVTTANPLYTEDELATQLVDAGAHFLVTVPPFLEKARAAATKAGVEEVFVFGEAEGATPFAALLAGGAEPPAVAIEPDDLVVLPYSSGTTGFPKGVQLTHGNLVANIAQCFAQEIASPDDTLLAVLPFFHIYGMNVLMNMGLYAGATVVTMPRFDLEEFLRVMQDRRVTVAYLVPPIVLALAKHPLVDRYDLSSLRTIWSGAAPLGSDLAAACGARVGSAVRQGYGLTETSPVTHRNLDDGARTGSIGQLVPNTECKIVDSASGAELGPGEHGELLIRGPQVMRGYLNNSDATAHAIDAAGWLRTGDIGYADPDGYFYIVDRAKELIKYKGYQVAPAELEALLVTHPAVADAAVIPIADEEAGEVPKAFVALKGAATADALMSFVADRVAPFKKIREVEVVDEIPKSAAGKILRRVLIERERARSDDRTATAANARN